MRNSIKLFSSIAILSSSLFAVENAKSVHLGEMTWQLYGFNEEVDLVETLKGSPINILWSWNNDSGEWNGYSPEYTTRKKLSEQNITVVETLPSNQGFWIRSYEEIDLEIQSVYYPLYDMCVNVNSEEFWENHTDENNTDMVSVYPACENYLETLADFTADSERANIAYDSETNSIYGDFTTNLPVVFFGDYATETTTALNSISTWEDFIETNGTISSATVSILADGNGDGDVVDFSFSLDDNNSFYPAVTISVGNDSNFSKLFQLSISTDGIFE
jgi:hypothetical protein